MQLNRTKEAIAHLRIAHRLNPRHADALKLLAAQCMTVRDFASAIAVLAPAVAAPTADEEMYLLLVESYQTAEDSVHSFEVAQKAVKRFPASPGVNCWMGFLLQFSGRYEDAERYLEAARRAAPDYPATYYLLADVLLKQHKFEQALPHFQKAIQFNPSDVDARIGLGQALAGLDRLTEAAQELELAAKVAPQEARVHFQLSRVYFRLGDEKKAEREAELSAKYRPPVQPLLTDVPNVLKGAAGPH